MTVDAVTAERARDELRTDRYLLECDLSDTESDFTRIGDACEAADARAEAADRVLRAVVDVAEEREPEKPLPTHAAVEAVQRLRAELERVRWSEKEQRVRADRAEKERDAALAAVDAVRADYAPRQEPPTAEEVRALARLWPHHDGAAVVLLRVLSRTGDRVAPHAVSVIVENDGTVEGFAANDMDKLHRADGWRAECPDGPVAWSHLAAMVARGGDRG